MKSLKERLSFPLKENLKFKDLTLKPEMRGLRFRDMIHESDLFMATDAVPKVTTIIFFLKSS